MTKAIPASLNFCRKTYEKGQNTPSLTNKKARRKAHQTDNLAKLRLEFLSVLELIAKDWLCGSTKKILSKGKGFCKRKIRAKRHGFSWWRGVDSFNSAGQISFARANRLR